MQIKVVTRHSPSNYGSLLQSIATIRILQQMGHDAEIIDYVRTDDSGLCKVWTEAKHKTGNLLKRLVYLAIRYPIEKIAEIRFARMRKKYLKMTKCVRMFNDLKKIDKMRKQ